MKLIKKLVVWLSALIVVAGLGVVQASSASAAVRSCASSTPVANRPVLRHGDTGSCVKVLQSALNTRGAVPKLVSDGSFGPGTKSAVLSYQGSHGLVRDGIVGPLTWKSLVGGATPPPTYNISRGPNNTSRVVLTYDDCPKSLSAFKTVVDYARSHNIGLVLAPTGDCIRSGRFDATYARVRGQYVINHSVSHPNLTTLSYSSVMAQLGSPGVQTNYGRPPYGAVNSTVRSAYAAKGMRIWTWNVDTNDWTGKSQTSVVSYVGSNAYAGNTVLMHMQWNGFNTSAIPQMVSRLQARGLGVCRAHSGTTPVNLPASLPC